MLYKEFDCLLFRDMHNRDRFYDRDARGRHRGEEYRDGRYHGGPGGYMGRGRGNPHYRDERNRIFVALFDYDPPTMSPNPDACDEELPFREGQLIKVRYKQFRMTLINTCYGFLGNKTLELMRTLFLKTMCVVFMFSFCLSSWYIQSRILSYVNSRAKFTILHKSLFFSFFKHAEVEKEM